MRDRLIELINKSRDEYPTLPLINGCKPSFANFLADYLLANGVIVPPCKVGDTVYALKENGTIVKGIAESIHQNLVGNEQGRWIVTSWFNDYYADSKKAGFECGTHLYSSFDDFNKTVFLTREEAEQALKGEIE